ncbi:MAG: response regulator [Candidatus Riflebacteria bacterium]|nr:response regulator [Candidatus Riflebacteria bacterium]
MAKILLVDDDVDFIEINRDLLESEGHKIIYAYNPDDGMKLLRSEKPDLIILDVMMQEPDDGFAMAQKIKKEKINIPILLLTSISKITGLNFEKDEKMLPVKEILEKPVSREKLLESVKNCLKS